MAIKKSELEKVIKEKFTNAIFILTDIAGDEDHYSIQISSPEFNNLSLIQSHRLINEKLKDYIGSQVHAFTILSINKI